MGGPFRVTQQVFHGRDEGEWLAFDLATLCLANSRKNNIRFRVILWIEFACRREWGIGGEV